MTKHSLVCDCGNQYFNIELINKRVYVKCPKCDEEQKEISSIVDFI